MLIPTPFLKCVCFLCTPPDDYQGARIRLSECLQHIMGEWIWVKSEAVPEDRGIGFEQKWIWVWIWASVKA